MTDCIGMHCYTAELHLRSDPSSLRGLLETVSSGWQGQKISVLIWPNTLQNNQELEPVDITESLDPTYMIYSAKISKIKLNNISERVGKMVLSLGPELRLISMDKE